MVINDLDSDIGPPSFEDFDPCAKDTASYIMLQAELNRNGKNILPAAVRPHDLLVVSISALLPPLLTCAVTSCAGACRFRTSHDRPFPNYERLASRSADIYIVAPNFSSFSAVKGVLLVSLSEDHHLYVNCLLRANDEQLLHH